MKANTPQEREEELNKLNTASSAPSRTKNQRSLALDEIKEAPGVFRFRNATQITEYPVVKEMTRHLENVETPLDPILVAWTALGWTVADGHLRLIAYRRAKWTRRVPVEFHEGTLEDAMAKALNRNRKVRLTMNAQERADAAWYLVVGPGRREGWPAERIANVTGVSSRLVFYMRKVAKTMRQAEEEPLSYDSWGKARAKAQGWDQPPEDQEFDVGARAEELRLRFAKAFGRIQRHDIKPLAAALYAHMGDMAAGLGAELGGYLEYAGAYQEEMDGPDDF